MSVADVLARIGAQREPSRWSKEALHYTRVGKNIRCLKCPNFCELKEGETGACRNRVNIGGTLYTTAYGNPCAVHIDPIEKKPFFHFLPTIRAFSIAAAGCNLRCLNCQNWQISQFSPEQTENYDLMPDRVVEECRKNNCESIAYTYSEPTTFYEYTLDTATRAREKKIKNVLKSNGYINEKPLRQLCGVLDAANIDLKTFDDGIYRKLAQARLDPVLKTLRILREEGVWLEVTNLVVPGWTDDAETVRRMCGWLCENGLADAPLHFTRFTPLYKLTHLPATPVSTLEDFRTLARSLGVRYAYVGNVPGHAWESTYCHNCGKLVIERRGFAILANHVRQGSCEYCGTNIPGVWHR
jgi:pyruvate formate lyase activating enzyme